MWDLKTGLLLKSILNSDGTKRVWKVKCMINSPQSNEILIGSTSSAIRTLDLNSFTINPKNFLRSHSFTVKHMEFLTNECHHHVLFQSRTSESWRLVNNVRPYLFYSTILGQTREFDSN